MASEISPTSQRLISCDFLTSSYRIVGKTMVSNTGLMGLMNDSTSAFMEILDAKMARVHMPTKLVDHFEVIRIVKPQVLAEYPVRIATQVYELEGTLEWAGRFEFTTIMVEGTREFVPIYNGTLTATLIPTFKIESQAFLFNRRHVDLLALISQQVKD
jgi:hypothetical protein